MILVKINLQSIAKWKDRAGVVVWKNANNVTWADAETLFVSHEGFADTHYWDDYLIAMDAPRRDIKKTYGGYAAMSFGTFKLMSTCFTDTDNWPPPVDFEVLFYYTPDTEANLELLFSGTGYRTAMDRTGITYDVFPEQYDIDLLLQETNYDGETVYLSRAFGHVKHVAPVRLADVGGAPTYHKGYIGGTTTPKITTGITQVSGTTLRAAATGHGFSNGDSIRIEGALSSTGGVPFDYDGVYAISNVAANTFDFDVSTASDAGPYNDGAFHADPGVGQAMDNDSLSSYLRVFDDGVPVPGNVTDNGDGTFSLSAIPFNVTMSGYGADTTLSNIMSWGCGQNWLSLNYDSANGRATSPDCHFWADTNRVLIEFLSDACAFWNHLFHIDYGTSTLYLIDMQGTNGARSVDTGDIFPSDYPRKVPVANLTAKWTARTRVLDRTNDGKYVKEETKLVTRTSGYPYGDELQIDPFTDIRSDLEGALDDILNTVNAAKADIALPLTGSPPAPGEQITVTEDTLGDQSFTAVIKAREMRYDFRDETLYVTGEGTIS